MKPRRLVGPRLDRPRLADEVGATARLALPLILARLAGIGSNIVDTLLAGHVGAHVLGGVAVGANIWWLAIVCGTGMMMSVPPSVAQLDGAGRRGDIGVVFRHALWLALVMGILLWFGVRHAGTLIDVLGVAPDLHDEVQAFLHAISWGAPALTLFLALRGLSEGLSMPRVSAYFNGAGLVLLAPLGYVFMFGKLGIPPQGAFGCGLATSIVLWLQLLAFATYVLTRHTYDGLGIRDRIEWPELRHIAPLVRIGLPIAVSLLAEVGLFVAAALSISTLGEAVTAGHQVALNVVSLLFMIPLGLAMAITVRVGHAVGRGDIQGVRYAAFCGIAMVLSMQLISAGLMMTFPRFIASLYTHDTNVISVSTQLLILAALFQLSDGMQAASQGALRGLKDSRVPMTITLFAYWGIGLPTGCWLAFERGLGARGMWMGLIAGLTTAAVPLFARLWRLSHPERFGHRIRSPY